MKHQDLSREELFALVWERPTIEVAHELGISDVALAKKCRRLQVPKPPRGYWARVKSGKTPKKPPLKAYCDQFVEDVQPPHRKQPHNGLYSVKLSEMQRDYFQNALDELKESGVDVTHCRLRHDSVRGLSPELAAQVLILVQHRFEKWLPKDASSRQRQGAIYCGSNVVEKLLPVAKKQVVLLNEKSDGFSKGPTLILHVTPEMLQLISGLHHTINHNRLSYAARKIDNTTHAWTIRELCGVGSYGNTVSEILVSRESFWIRSSMPSTWGNDRTHTTEEIPLQQIIPTGLLPRDFKDAPTTVRCQAVRPYNDRIDALVVAERMFEEISNAAYEIEDAAPKSYLALIEKVWAGSKDGPFSAALQEKRQLEETLTTLEDAIELEKAQLCRDVLGICKGDNALFRRQDQLIRICLDSCYMHISGDKISFNLGGLKYRKDGILGKRDDYHSIQVSRNSGVETRTID